MVGSEWPHWIQPYDVWVGHPPKLPLDRLLLLCGILWLSASARFIRRQVGNALCRMFFSWTIGRSLPVPLMAWLGSRCLEGGRIELGWPKTLRKHSSLRELKLSERSLTKSHLIRPARMCYFLGLSRVDAPGPGSAGSHFEELRVTQRVGTNVPMSSNCKRWEHTLPNFGTAGSKLQTAYNSPEPIGGKISF